MRTRVQIDFVVQHDGNRVLGTFNINDFIVAGCQEVGVMSTPEGGEVRILPGARLGMRVDHRKLPYESRAGVPTTAIERFDTTDADQAEDLLGNSIDPITEITKIEKEQESK